MTIMKNLSEFSKVSDLLTIGRLADRSPGVFLNEPGNTLMDMLQYEHPVIRGLTEVSKDKGWSQLDRVSMLLIVISLHAMELEEKLAAAADWRDKPDKPDVDHTRIFVNHNLDEVMVCGVHKTDVQPGTLCPECEKHALGNLPDGVPEDVFKAILSDLVADVLKDSAKRKKECH